LVDAVLGDLGQLAAYDRQDLVELGRQAADRHSDQPRVDVLAGEREDRVRQAALLANLLEETAGRAAAESRVQDPEREPARVRTSEALDAEHPVDLLEVTSGLDQARGGLARPVGTPSGYGLSCAVEEALTREGPPDQPDEAGVVDTAGHRDHHPLGAVVAAIEPAYLL